MNRFQPAGLATVIVLLLAAGAIGCSTAPAKKSPTMKAADTQFTVDANVLRVRARSAVGPLTGVVQESANEIMSGTDDPRIRMEALLWKSDGVPAVREALFRSDPLVALLDTWVLCAQLEDYFETGPGAEKLGAWAHVAREAAREMESWMEQAIKEVIHDQDISRGRAFVDAWAAEHPIDSTIPGRRTILAEAGRFKAGSGVGGFRMVGNLAVTMDDLTRQLEIYTNQIPKQARWEAQLAVLELVGPEEFERTVDQLPEVLELAGRVDTVLEQLPAMVGAEREAVLDALRRERIETLEFVREERLDTLAHLQRERVAVLADVDGLRVASLEMLQQEVREVIAVLREERAAVLEQVDAIGESTVARTHNRAEQLIDHLFLRIVQLLALVLVCLLLLGALVWLAFRRKPRTA